MTVVHPPEDARIRHRQIAALRRAGWHVVLAAPFAATHTPPRDDVVAVDLPRAVGRRRSAALTASRRVLSELAASVDLVLIHDPELLLVLPGLALPPVVWDVHEDTAAAVVAKPWLPPVLQPAAASAVRLLERSAGRRVHVLLAEAAYADRFGPDAVVVPNLPDVPAQVPPPGRDRVVYLGAVSRARGVDELAQVGRLLRSRHGDAMRLEVVGNAHPDARPLLQRAHADGDLRWHGFQPNDVAVGHLRGALAGLSLLHDLPNYRHSMPTKVVEYLAYGLPVVTTPLPLAADLVDRASAGVVVPFGDPEAVVAAVEDLRADDERRARLGRSGHGYARAHLDWGTRSAEFVDALAGWLPARAG